MDWISSDVIIILSNHLLRLLDIQKEELDIAFSQN